MYFDLNVPIPTPIAPHLQTTTSKKGKQKQTLSDAPHQAFTAAQIAVLESKIDLLVRLGYTVIALNQFVLGKIDPKTTPNYTDEILSRLSPRQGVAFMKRLTIVLDEGSEKGFGLTNNAAVYFATFDILALQPTTAATFSATCLTHTLPSPLTVHIISLPLTLPRLPFHFKHTLVRSALKNGACFEIDYGGALHLDETSRRNWWAGSREVMRVTKGKGLVYGWGGEDIASLRGPRDVANLLTLIGIAQDTALDGVSKTPKSLVLRAQTRRTYRAIISEPKLIIPRQAQGDSTPPEAPAAGEPESVAESLATTVPVEPNETVNPTQPSQSLKRPLDTSTPVELDPSQPASESGAQQNDAQRKKRQRK
ncbi:PHP domain-like protein [Sistotremastrum niveocremeum HHB9708]|uniref:PHP domain-like protein n=1 Tax=Sistotremastrum niveocremeum HHB9708 TaxID=1314777 RepID=A0A164N1D1_9AGAM|nr:PHP domain-like protein [Sistotremastrum niveocremeum HHB9708]